MDVSIHSYISRSSRAAASFYAKSSGTSLSIITQNVGWKSEGRESNRKLRKKLVFKVICKGLFI